MILSYSKRDEIYFCRAFHLVTSFHTVSQKGSSVFTDAVLQHTLLSTLLTLSISHYDLIYTQQQGSSLYKIKIHVSSRQMETLPAHKLRAKQAEFSHILTTKIFSSINLSSSVMFESLSAQTNTSVLEININIKKKKSP